jgi:iron-sulfur cluster repair protein YtfE (RIC family)
MLHAIGRRPRPSGDLVDMLLECHARIRMFSDLAVAISERMLAPLAEVSDVCTRVERYFGDALPLHVRDEEESILPRLRGRSSAIDAMLDRMHEQHEIHDRLIERLLDASAAVRVAPGDPAVRAALHTVATPLRAVLEPHLVTEEELIFPAIRDLVSPEEQEAIISELKERRILRA